MSLDGISPNSCVGIQGQPGPRGRSIFSDYRAPSSTVGEPGDFYVDMLNKRFYGPKLESTGWPAEYINFTGERGEQGEPGPQGETGEQGPPGDTGPQGAQGPQGVQGIQGIPGLDGTNGADGADGVDGAPGPAAWTAVDEWETGLTLSAGPPANVVTHMGSTYVTLVSHTAGTFATDLAAGKLALIAAKGTDGAGAGDVLKPGGTTNLGKVAIFDNADGSQLAALAIGAGSETSLIDRQAGDARYQGLDLQLTAFAGLAGGANKLAYFTGAAEMSLTDFTALARTFLANTDGGAALADLVAPGAAGNVLTSDGTTWSSEAPAAGGTGWETISTVNANSATEHTFTLNPEYKSFRLVFDNVTTSATGRLALKVKKSGSTSGSQTYRTVGGESEFAGTIEFEDIETKIGAFDIKLGRLVSMGNPGVFQTHEVQWPNITWNSTGGIDGVVVTTDGPTFTAGTITLRGRK